MYPIDHPFLSLLIVSFLFIKKRKKKKEKRVSYLFIKKKKNSKLSNIAVCIRTQVNKCRTKVMASVGLFFWLYHRGIIFGHVPLY